MTRTRLTWTVFALCAVCGAGGARAADPSEVPKPGSQPLDEVVISTQKFDRRTLDRVIVPRFVQSHGAPSPMIDQVARWQNAVCPQTTGLQGVYNEFVSRRVVAAAQAVGAPTRKKCSINIEIVFTPTPQELLDHLAKAYPALLGSTRSPKDKTFARAVEAWYLTGTRSMAGVNPPVTGLDTPPDPGGDNAIAPAAPAAITPGIQVDLPNGLGTAPSGLAGSHLGMSLRSEFLHVMVIVDSRKVTGLPLGALSDYVAMIALTRMVSLDTCSELPSIIDLLSAGCGERAKPGAITAADTAFLKALYDSNLEFRLNLEQGEMHDRMLAGLETR
jgi:hypothetical protein